MKTPILSCLFLFINIVLLAQKNKPVTGYLRDSATHAPVVLASVTNMNTHQTVMTGNNGRFKINIKENETLSFAAVGYHFDTVQYVSKYAAQDSIELFLVALTHDLGNVTVIGKGYNTYQLDSMERRNDFFQGRTSYTKPTFALSNTGAGLGISIDRFSRHEKAKRRAIEFFETNEKEEYINYRYSSKLIAVTTGFKDEQLRDFMQKSRPSYQWLRKNNDDESIFYYVNDQLKKWSAK